MKYIFTAIAVGLSTVCLGQTLEDTTLLQPVELTAVRASEAAPLAKSTITQAQLSQDNHGRDLPFLLERLPSVVVNSDAGNGVGYTGIRIRGSDATRINVTLNGIPYNDAESQGTFFVDVPDIASSANSIQVQRGVGSSTNGSGAFGGSINIGTNEPIRYKKMQLNTAYGSFNTLKNTFIYNSGLIGKHFTADARLSNIRSDGFIDRATSSLQSLYTSIAYTGKNNSLRFNVLSGKEKTYQAWNGVDEETLKTNRTYNSAGTEKPGDPYENEVDDYKQDHYQLFYNHRFSARWRSNIAVFLTKGKGYYEQYKAGESFSNYSLPDFDNGDTVITETDLVRRLWLDNDMYGSIFSVQYNGEDRQFIFGGNANHYDGKHFGDVVKTIVPVTIPAGHKWYDVDAVKADLSAYGKWTQKLSSRWQSYLDLQVRSVDYTINGFRYNPSIRQQNDYLFFNPKAGVSYRNKNIRAYASFSRAAKEPNRDDFESGVEIPRAEILHDVEAGISRFGTGHSWGLNFYYMNYKDQLVLTGRINDVGAYTRTNIPESYRAGVEVEGMRKISSWLTLSANTTLSTNRVKNFTEYIDDYDNGGQRIIQHDNTSLPFSPSMISMLSMDIVPFKNSQINLTGKYVSRQFLDNTSNKTRSLDPYYVQDVRLSYTLETKTVKAIKIFVLLNNLLSEKYEANGYTFSYYYGGKLITENYYFPMAGRNIMVGVNVEF